MKRKVFLLTLAFLVAWTSLSNTSKVHAESGVTVPCFKPGAGFIMCSVFIGFVTNAVYDCVMAPLDCVGGVEKVKCRALGSIKDFGKNVYVMRQQDPLEAIRGEPVTWYVDPKLVQTPSGCYFTSRGGTVGGGAGGGPGVHMK